MNLGPAVFQTAMRHRRPQPVALPIRACGGCGVENPRDRRRGHTLHTTSTAAAGVGWGGDNYLAALHHSVVWLVAGMLRPSVYGAGRVTPESLIEDYVFSAHYTRPAPARTAHTTQHNPRHGGNGGLHAG
eukprot:5756908-Pyramimonas_sp.AAC.1